MAEMVTLTLAHPLTLEQAARRRAKDVKDYNIGMKITVPFDDALAIIKAGFAAVDPEDSAQVQKAVGEPKTETTAAKKSS